MGIAPGTKEVSGMHVWAVYANIQTFAALHGLDAGSLLGHVIAHEIGHLLLQEQLSFPDRSSCVPDGTDCR